MLNKTLTRDRFQIQQKMLSPAPVFKTLHVHLLMLWRLNHRKRKYSRKIV